MTVTISNVVACHTDFLVYGRILLRMRIEHDNLQSESQKIGQLLMYFVYLEY